MLSLQIELEGPGRGVIFNFNIFSNPVILLIFILFCCWYFTMCKLEDSNTKNHIKFIIKTVSVTNNQISTLGF